MTFWGVELKPEKPYVHSDEDDMTTLHLSQATLGLQFNGPKRCVVKCKVGENPEVLLCSLVPGVQESCALDLLFDQDVTFTVVGPTSVHLTEYYMPVDYDSEDEDDYDSEEDGLEFSEGDEDVSDLEGLPNSVKIEEVKEEDAAKKAILAITNGKKRKKGDSAVKAGKGEDTVMGEEGKDDDGLPKKAAVDSTPVKKQAVAGAGGVPTPGAATPSAATPGAATPTADTPASQGKKNKRNRNKNKQNQNGTPTPTPTADTPTSQGKMSKSERGRTGGTRTEPPKPRLMEELPRPPHQPRPPNLPSSELLLWRECVVCCKVNI